MAVGTWTPDRSHTITPMKKPLLTAALLFMAASFACAQTLDAGVAPPADAASSPALVKAKHRKPMHVEPTQPKVKKHHPKKVKSPVPQSSAPG